MKQPEIKVGLLLASEVQFQLKGEFINALQESSSWYRATMQDNRIVLQCADGSTSSHSTINFQPADGSTSFLIKDVVIGIDFHWEQKRDFIYKGSLMLTVENDKIRAINTLPLEEYLRSVISSEMSAKSSHNLLKAHAVISRSWLVAQVLKSNKIKDSNYQTINDSSNEYIRWYDREDHQGFDVCADDHCQRYQGITEIILEKVDVAIHETYGEFLTYEGEICDARFSKCCGGVSESFHHVWEPEEHQYLSPVLDLSEQTELPNLQHELEAQKFILEKPASFCNTSDRNILATVLPDFDQATHNFFRWQVKYNAEELRQLILKRSGVDYGELLAITPLERGASGRIIKLKIEGTKCTRIIGKELEIRRTLSESHLYSSAFVVKTEKVNQKSVSFQFDGAGWGHGVGLCQIGAAVMGAKGYSYEAILQHYFKGAKLEKRY